MTFRKAEQLINLATMVAAHHGGVTLDDVIERFEAAIRHIYKSSTSTSAVRATYSSVL